MTKAEEKQALAERSFWRRVGRIIDPKATLYAWSYYDSGSFRQPDVDIPGPAAKALIGQHRRIETLTAQLAAQREVVAADDEYRRKVVLIFRAPEESRYRPCMDADAAWNQCEQAREAAEQIDKEDPKE